MRKSLNELCPKICCEVCGENDKSTLHRHHIIERTELDCTNHHMNLAVVCSNCHNKIHAGELKLIGVFPSTKPPVGRTLVYIRNGVCNVPGMENSTSYYKSKPKAMTYYTNDKEEK